MIAESADTLGFCMQGLHAVLHPRQSLQPRIWKCCCFELILAARRASRTEKVLQGPASLGPPYVGCRRGEAILGDIQKRAVARFEGATVSRMCMVCPDVPTS